MGENEKDLIDLAKRLGFKVQIKIGKTLEIILTRNLKAREFGDKLELLIKRD